MKIVRKTNSQHFEQAIKDISTTAGRIGWTSNIRYQDGTPVASVAAQNEFGNPAKKIPARPFMRPTAHQKGGEWRDNIAKGSKLVLMGKRTVAVVLEQALLQALGDIKKTISEITTPPLSQKTIDARLSKMRDGKTIGNLTKPLVETKYMLNSPTVEVFKK